MKSRVLAIVAALALAITGAVGTAAPASAANNGKITGIVKVGNQPLEGVDVDIFLSSTGQDVSHVTGAGGTFSFTGLKLGTWSLSVSDTDVSQFFSMNVALTSSAPSKTVTVAPTPWATGTSVLNGQVTTGALPLPNVGVSISPARIDTNFRSLTVDANGRWEVGGLPAGRYTIDYTLGGYQSKEVDVTVANHETQDASASMSQPSATVSGTLRDGDGNPVPDGFVDIVSDDSTDLLDSVELDENAHYSANLAPGGYTISTGGQWNLDTHHVVLGVGDHVTVDLSAISPELGTISGKATTTSGAAIAGICVIAVNSADEGTAGSEERTTSTGLFTITDVPPGDYSVEYVDCSTRAKKYARVYEGGGITWDQDSVEAKRFHVDPGEHETGHVQKLVPGSLITGTATVLAGDGATTLPAGHYPEVDLYALVDGVWTNHTIYENRFGTSGAATYGAGPVLPGTYRLGVVDVGQNPFPERFYKTGTDLDSATNIVVTSGVNRTGINATFTATEPADDPVPVGDAALTPSKQNVIIAPATAKQGQTIPVTVGKAYVGQYVSVWLFSTPVPLRIWGRVNKTGTITVSPIPLETLSGEHKIVVQSTDDGVIGWRSIFISGGRFIPDSSAKVLIDDSATPLHASLDGFPVDATVTYQWWRGTNPLQFLGKPIPGATGATYTPVAADNGYKITVLATIKVPEYAPVMQYSDFVDTNLHSTGALTIAGELKLNSELTADDSALAFTDRNGAVSPGVGTQWLANGVAITGATGSTYTPPASMSGKKISVKLTATVPGRTPLSVTSAATNALGANAFSGAGTPLGDVHLDAATNTLSITDFGMDVPAGTTVKYAWYRGGSAVAGKTASSYKLTSADAGYAISVAVSFTKTGYTPVIKHSVPVDYTMYPSTFTTISLQPAAQVGATATAAPPTFVLANNDPVSPTFTYQWYANGVAISGATHETYVIMSAQYGKTLTVRVTPVFAGAIARAVPCQGTPVVAKGIIYGGDVTVTVGDGKVGHQQLLAPQFTDSLGNPVPVTITGIQWLRDGVAISGATKAAYTPVTADAGKTLTVRFTVSKVNYISRTLTSAGVEIQPADG